MNPSNPEVRSGIFRQTAESFRSGLESNLLGTPHSLSRKIRGFVHEGQEGFIARSKLAWIGATTAVWLGSAAAALKGSQVINHIELTQDEPAVVGLKMIGSLMTALVVTSIADRFLLRRVLR